MKGIFDMLEGVEALATRILVWVIHIPKTLLWIIFYPAKVREEVHAYINKDLNPDNEAADSVGKKDGMGTKLEPSALSPTDIKESKNTSYEQEAVKGKDKDKSINNKKNEKKKQPLEGYVPPVILLLVVALVPPLLLSFRHPPYVEITMPAEEINTAEVSTSSPESASQNAFELNAKFTSSADNMKYKIKWWVEKKVDNSQNEEVVPESGFWKQLRILFSNAPSLIEEKINNGQYERIEEPEEHSELAGTAGTISKDGNNIVKDTFYYRFPKPGKYYINVNVQKVSPREKKEALVVALQRCFTYNDVLHITTTFCAECVLVHVVWVERACDAIGRQHSCAPGDK